MPETDNELVNEAITNYREYVIAQSDVIVEEATVFTDAVRAGDLEAARPRSPTRRRGSASSRSPAWSPRSTARSTPGSTTSTEVARDRLAPPRVHPVDQGTTEAPAQLADQLDADLATLQEEIQTVDFPPAVVALGAAELVQEVTEGKITGEEDRYSRTDLWDFAANIEGAEVVIDELTPALEEADPELLADIQAGFAEVTGGLEPYQDGDGYLPYSELTDEDKDELQAQLAGLSEDLALVPGALGLEQ